MASRLTKHGSAPGSGGVIHCGHDRRDLAPGAGAPLLDGVLGLRVADHQRELVASVQKSLAQVAADPALQAYGDRLPTERDTR